MKILIACEYSGVVREAFAKECVRLGISSQVMSCDLIPTEMSLSLNSSHYQGDVLDIINNGWDIIIAFPPCTYLSYAGIRWFNEEKYGNKAIKRKALGELAVEFVMTLWSTPSNYKCIENPVGYLNTVWRKPDQVIHPYYFGDPESKRTCLWLDNLPLLSYTKIVEPKVYSVRNGDDYKYYRTETIKNQKERSRLFNGIASAMASQWLNYINNQRK